MMTWFCYNEDLSLVPPLKKRTRHWCNHGWSGSMANALFTDWSINRYFSETRRWIVNLCEAQSINTLNTLDEWVKNDLNKRARQPFLK